MLGQPVLPVALVLLKRAHQGPVVSRVGKHVVSLPPLVIIASCPGGRDCSFCCCAAVFGVTTLEPAAMRRSCSLWVCVPVLAQPTARARSAQALIRLNAVNMCFLLCIFLVSQMSGLGRFKRGPDVAVGH
jgi:hypothetical protein